MFIRSMDPPRRQHSGLNSAMAFLTKSVTKHITMNWERLFSENFRVPREFLKGSLTRRQYCLTDLVMEVFVNLSWTSVVSDSIRQFSHNYIF